MIKKLFVISVKIISLLKKSNLCNILKKVIYYIRKNHRYKKWLNSRKKLDKSKKYSARTSKNLTYKPLISIIMPVYNTPEKYLQSVIESVCAQVYANWELCICDDASTQAHVVNLLRQYEANYKNIKVFYSKKNQHISMASNNAMSLAKGEFITLLDHDDILAPDALLENVKLLNANRKIDFIYSDEDKLDLYGNRCEPFFKPDWSLDFFLTLNYICHFSVIRKSLVKKAGGFRKGYEGSQDYDLFLRCISLTDKISHIPKILYHWRMSQQLTGSTKSYASIAGIKSLKDYIRKNKIKADVLLHEGTIYRVKYEVSSKEIVSIIIRNTTDLKLIKRCIDSIYQNTKLSYLDITILASKKMNEDLQNIIKLLSEKININLVFYDKKQDEYKKLILEAKKVKGKHILFIDSHVKIVESKWLSSLLEYSSQKDIGAVGAQLLYKNKSIVLSGYLVNTDRTIGNPYNALQNGLFTFIGTTGLIRNFSIVTPECFMIKKCDLRYLKLKKKNCSWFENVVSMSLGLLSDGKRNVQTPYSHLILNKKEENISGLKVPFKFKNDSFSNKNVYCDKNGIRLI